MQGEIESVVEKIWDNRVVGERRGTDAPCMRFQRTSVSCTELVSAWPMCSTPVTLGGGMTMVNLGLSVPFFGVKKPHFSHHSYHRASTSAGWYELSSTLFTFFFSPGCSSPSPHHHPGRLSATCGAPSKTAAGISCTSNGKPCDTCQSRTADT